MPSAIRVLVVDDDEDICMTTANLLQWKGHEARSALTGEEAIRQVTSFSPDLVLLDISLPDMDGPAIARAIRNTAGIKDPVIAAVSGHADLMHKRRCAAAGFDHYLLKPVDPLALDQLMWLVDDRVARRENFLTLQRERLAVCYALARSQLEFFGLLLDSVAASRDPVSNARCLEKVQKMESRLTAYLANEIGFSEEQTSALQILLRGLRVRVTSVLADRPDATAR